MKTKKFDELRDALYERSPGSRERVAEEVERVTAELGLAELRARTERTQEEIAHAIGTSQSGVSRLERQQDVLVSTLRDYVAATGGRLHLVARYPDHEHEIHLPVPEGDPQPPRSFRVIWQNTFTRQLVHVGWLEYTGMEFAFSYATDAHLHSGFEPFAAFPDITARYQSAELFPFFAERLVSAAKPEYRQLIAALGLTRSAATPVELLARSWGTSPHDTIQIVPEPLAQSDGTESRFFLVSGVRHVDEARPDRVGSRVSRLKRGQRLDLRDEPDNPNNPEAIVLEAAGKPVGWMPDYLLDEVRKLRGSTRELTVSVEQANGPDVPWHLRLLCRLDVSPEPSH